MEQTEVPRERVADRVVELLEPDELVRLARRALEGGDGPTALALQGWAEERMAWLLRPGERLRRRE